MNLLMIVAVACLIMGTLFGMLLLVLIRYLRKFRKALVITVNPATGEVDLLDRRPKGEDYLQLLGSDVPLEADRRYHYGSRPALIVNTVTGLPMRAEDAGLLQITGQRLREIRKAIKIKVIAAANSANLEALAKYALIGIGIVGVLLIGAIIMIFKVMKGTGAA